MFKRYSMVCFILCVMLACSQPKKPSKDVIFITHITHDGLKQFRFSVAQPGRSKQGTKDRDGQKLGGSRGGHKGKRGAEDRAITDKIGENSKKRNPGQMKKRIEEKLFKTEYCREGFMEIHHYSEAGRYYFNGQCNEKATAKDRQRYK